MFVIETDTTIIYPVSFNQYIKKLNDYSVKVSSESDESDIGQKADRNILLPSGILMSDGDVQEIHEELRRYSPDKTIIIDFQGVKIKDCKNFSVLVSKEANRVILSNLSRETGIFDKAVKDLNVPIEEQDGIRGIIYSNSEVRKWAEQNEKATELSEVYNNHIAALVSGCMKSDEKPHQFQESSCVFSNKYVNIKDIFRRPSDARFLLYRLALKVRDIGGSVGSYKLICTSKTGAILANIISKMIDVPVVYCVGMGPRFAVRPDEIVEVVQENERYVYIFDFISLGTELKILSTFISDKKSKLIGGVGPASYIHCNHEEIVKRKLILSKMHPLINIQDYKEIDYKIEIP